jgi:uncharacterized membrane protein YqjE
MSANHQHHAEELREESIAELVKRLAAETNRLVQQEIELAKAELTEKAKVAGRGAGMLGGAGVAGLLALGALTACLIALLATWIGHVWIAALVVAVVWTVLAGVLALRGRDELREAAPPAPQQTIESVKEDVAWARTRTRSATR